MYAGGASANLGGNGIINGSGNANDFVDYGLPTNISLNFSGNGTFKEIIYASNADFTMNGGGLGSEDFIGASITKTVTMNGHFKFLNAEVLANYDNDGRYVVTLRNAMSHEKVLAFNCYPVSIPAN